MSIKNRTTIYRYLICGFNWKDEMMANGSSADQDGAADFQPEPLRVLRELWQMAGLDPSALDKVVMSGSDPVFPSSFAIGTAAQVAIAAAALAACEFGHRRGAPRQNVSVDMRHAALECTGWFSVNGHSPELFDALSGL
ncbi:hypothetical protein [Paraburkholderia panacisoli]|uniref:hypothetical protein n=1 Tax=Paraburkholderia panacisoli TaxID=2603818 RepID=UPI00319E7AA3